MKSEEEGCEEEGAASVVFEEDRVDDEDYEMNQSEVAFHQGVVMSGFEPTVEGACLAEIHSTRIGYAS